MIRTQQVFTAGKYVDYTYDSVGQLKAARGRESGGSTNRLQEQMGYGYDAEGNLKFRTNNALVKVLFPSFQHFGCEVVSS